MEPVSLAGYAEDSSSESPLADIPAKSAWTPLG